jgi:hypothetical protein
MEEAFPSLDIVYRDEVDPDINVKLGGEGLLMNKHLALRMGLAHTREMDMGLGYNSAGLNKNYELKVDYAFIIPFNVEGSQGTHRFSLAFLFDGASKKSIKIDSIEIRKKKVNVLWQEYVRLVEKGATFEERKKFLKKFLKKTRYYGVDVTFAEEEYRDILFKIDGLKSSIRVEKELELATKRRKF